MIEVVASVEDLTKDPNTGNGIVSIFSAGGNAKSAVAIVGGGTKVSSLRQLVDILKESDFLERNHYHTKVGLGKKAFLMFTANNDIFMKELQFFLDALFESDVISSPIVCDLTFIDIVKKNI